MRTERFRLGDEVVEVTPADLGDGRWSFRIARGSGASRMETTLELDARRLGDGHWLARTKDALHEARVEREPGGGEGRTVRFGAEHVALARIDPFEGGGGAGGGGARGPRKVAAPIPGRVISVDVAVGDAVAEGQAVVVVEAMKMANELRTPIAGRVKSVHAKAGDRVDAGVALVVVEPVPSS